MITYKNVTYPIIKKFNCLILNAEYHAGGSFFTTFAISPWYHRENNPTKAKVKIVRGDTSTQFFITDDWGTTDIVELSNDETEAIESATYTANFEGLL